MIKHSWINWGSKSKVKKCTICGCTKIQNTIKYKTTTTYTTSDGQITSVAPDCKDTKSDLDNDQSAAQDYLDYLDSRY